MIKRLFAVVFWPLLAVWAVWLLGVTQAHAQVLTPGVAYTTADPINPEQFGLATVDGRYRAQISDTGDCSNVGPDMRVYVWQVPSQTGSAMYTEVQPIQEDGQLAEGDVCFVIVYQKMTDVPCFQTDGMCDPNGEE